MYIVVNQVIQIW